MKKPKELDVEGILEKACYVDFGFRSFTNNAGKCLEAKSAKPGKLVLDAEIQEEEEKGKQTYLGKLEGGDGGAEGGDGGLPASHARSTHGTHAPTEWLPHPARYWPIAHCTRSVQLAVSHEVALLMK